MKRKIIVTGDGSKTIQIEDWDEQYHSKHGAVQEAYHVFIKHGLHHIVKNNIDILEIGFGTGLNALITLIESQKRNIQVNYVGVENYPVSPEEIRALNYIATLSAKKFEEKFKLMHNCPWGKRIAISPNFTLEKKKKHFKDILGHNLFNLIYFDAFGPRVQPELWTEVIFELMFDLLKKGGILVTYSAKGSVRRAMQQVGFDVERLEGPPGKREMLRATKK